MCLHVLCFGSLLLLGQVRVELIGTKVQECKTALVLYPRKKCFCVYRNHPVHPSIFLAGATPP